MSFLSSIGQYVVGMADSVAGLALSPRRAPPPRHRSEDTQQKPQPSTATMRGYPRVVPTEGVSALGARRRTLDCLAPLTPPRRGGSLRTPRQQPPEKPTMAFCKRRLSWPEVDNSVNSGVQDTDGSYFESFTALSWRQENRRLAALRLAEARAERPPPAPHDLGLPSVSAQLSHKEHDHLYTEVLYCIENAVGAPAPDGQFAAYKEEVIEYARRAFRVPVDIHARALRAAGSERPPTVVLGCAVIEADGLEAKDANGFSDPYCMLGIQPASLPASPRASEDEGRKHGFRLSFKRRDGRQQRDSLGRLPARYIRATSVRPHTLSPKWNETFKFDIDDISSDVLHLDIWDHDDESSVLDAVSRLNEVRGVRGLGRFFKQVCQSARQGSQDDFLGCVNIPLREIPSTGVEAWYKLEARSQRSSYRLEYLLRCLNQLSQMKAFWRCCPFNKEIRSEIVGALRKGTAEWYEALCAQDTRSERGEDLVNLITLVQIDLQQGLTYYHPLFETTNNVPYFTVVFTQIDKMVAEDVRLCVEHWITEGWCGVSEEELYDEHGNGVCVVSAKTLPFEVLAAVRELCAAAAPAPAPHPAADPPPQLLEAYFWFEPLIDRWLAVTKTMALQRVRAAVELDRPVEGEHIVKHSTSSVDTAACALHYADLVHGALADQGYYENHGQNKTTEEICTIVNNLEYVRRSLAEYDDEHIVNDDNARQLVRGALGTLDARSTRAAAPLAARARPPLRKAVFHLAWSPDTLPTPEAITPLLEYLDQHLSSLNTWLLPRAFTRALAGCWSAVLKEVWAQADAGGAEKPRVYHHRLREALDLLAEFFHAEGKGLPMSEVHSGEWSRLEQRMQFHQAQTEELLELWLADRVLDQSRTPLPSPYGSILVRVYFNHDSLSVEVLSARDVIPLDPNGLSDPFVVLELLPKRLFPKAQEQTTNVQKKTLNPVWDECFEFAVTLEMCRSPQATLALSVWDRDVLTADDFAGEAFVPLSRVSGVNSHALPDPLRPLELPLMQLHDRGHPILQILESRTTDKLAMDFVKKQKLRFAEQ
ncbi:PREDICTED: BAI1-associated protein 3 [Papilio polytes]|uniref:BAI1-associated protein 3 n=1 Tax=Papilio polytes TaxID=76194 RepID=UPI000675C9ED|nr:PREDICTED: BAI1-associated protein 3 [Papilio polytes]